MNTNRKVLIIGAGGIGSFLIPLLDRVGIYQIDVADPDKVEQKNLSYQNFEFDDVGINKAEAMSLPYNVKPIPYPILTDKQLKGYELVICCVDNLGLRKTLYNSDVKWLDLRAQGRNCAMISYEADPNQYDSLLAGDDSRSFSCQGDSWDGSNKGVHFMQVTVAGIGAQWIQRWFAGEDVPNFRMVNV